MREFVDIIGKNISLVNYLDNYTEIINKYRAFINISFIIYLKNCKEIIDAFVHLCNLHGIVKEMVMS